MVKFEFDNFDIKIDVKDFVAVGPEVIERLLDMSVAVDKAYSKMDELEVESIKEGTTGLEDLFYPNKENFDEEFDNFLDMLGDEDGDEGVGGVDVYQIGKFNKEEKPSLDDKYKINNKDAPKEEVTSKVKILNELKSELDGKGLEDEYIDQLLILLGDYL